VAALHQPGSALEVVKERLAPGGRLYLFNQEPGWKTPEPAEQFGARLGDVLSSAGFGIERVVVRTSAVPPPPAS